MDFARFGSAKRNLLASGYTRSASLYYLIENINEMLVYFALVQVVKILSVAVQFSGKAGTDEPPVPRLKYIESISLGVREYESVSMRVIG